MSVKDSRTWKIHGGVLAAALTCFAAGASTAKQATHSAPPAPIGYAWAATRAQDAARASDYSDWAVDTTRPGPDLPPLGRSLFDQLFAARSGAEAGYQIPFPFTALVDHIGKTLSAGRDGVRIALFPMGRSLQRVAAAPEFFKFPRLVLAVVGQPKPQAGILLKDRLYIGYLEKTNVLEVISYNELAGRFEFQLVKNYRAGAKPNVFQAPRAVCVACHQNHAPIFSKGLWEESNANRRVAALLAAERGEFHGVPAAGNIDVTDAIDQSTDRANALMTLQHIWTRACEDPLSPAKSRACRAAAYTAVLRYGLSGELVQGAETDEYQATFLSPVAESWRKLWPRGLKIADADIPNRNPFAGGDPELPALVAGAPAPGHRLWVAAADIAPVFDPLSPRPARELWHLTDARAGQRLIAGWAQFFSVADWHAIDARLRELTRARTAQTDVYQADCRLTPATRINAGMKLECEPTAGAAGASALRLSGRIADQSGVLHSLHFGAAAMREIELVAQSARKNERHYRLLRAGRGARLADGRALANLRLQWRRDKPVRPANSPQTINAQARMEVDDDFAYARAALADLVRTQGDLFDAAPLTRVRILPALFEKLGLKASECCAHSGSLPPAALELSAALAPADGRARNELQPFYRYCAECHYTLEHTPPNFLYGDARRVSANLTRCAPRIAVRLAAWGQDASAPAKTPMPPLTALPRLNTDRAAWTRSPELSALRSYVSGLLRAQGKPQEIDQLLRHGYEALPSCLPA